ncbi:integrase catalytic domain-containing protein [Trichonephila clavipes]|nr:integrase catalytic domain-containing protein [Trichonephila clavipes]
MAIRRKPRFINIKRVVFGITSSPFLLGATLEYHLKQVSGHLQLTAQKLLESFYVDNCLTSVDNAEDIERFMLESKEILSLAKFNLRGWVHTGVSEAEKARARVASIKPITIPRLELLACTIGSRLINTTKIDLGLENVPIYCWSDSVNALYWIKRKEKLGHLWNNRVQEIRRLTNPEDWKHIPGILNPADLPSRGCGVVELIASLWWEGPSWLNKPREEWPLSEACPDRATIDSERKRTVASTINHEPKEMDYLSEIPSFKKIIRVTAWIYRFYHNLRKQRNGRDFGELITQETDAAERKVLKIVQKQSFFKRY